MEATKKLQLLQKFFWFGFGVKQIIDFFSSSLILGQIFMKTTLNNRANHENLDLSHFFQKLDKSAYIKAF